MLPNIELYYHLEEGRIPATILEKLELALRQCLPFVLKTPEGPVPVLSDLYEVEVSIVDDAVIKDIHARFLNDPSETDVITFPHGDGLGEILISFDTALCQAKEFNQPIYRELFRYMVHGLLHLHGHIDTTSECRELMFSLQEPLVEQFAPTIEE